jgi:alpha-glucosidase
MKPAKWWQKVVFYQIYPRSFYDLNGDGIGDIPGIIRKLDYLKDLGIGAIWLSPHYPSPLADCGYDVSDYHGVGIEYGTLKDFQFMLKEAHKREIHIVLDMVLNHTSDQHAWFQESRSSNNNPKRDWYIWKKGKGNAPPNNWYSTFGGSAWELDPITKEYYYHFFFKEQPDLNWSNSEVNQAMFDVLRYWLDMGVDGFRLDAIGTIFEDPRYLDHQAPFNVEEYYKICRSADTEEKRKALPAQWEEMFHFQHDQPGIHELMRELRRLTDEYKDRVLIGETDDLSFYGKGDDELHMVFNFPLMNSPRLTPQVVQENQEVRISGMPERSWAANTLGNHDTPRMFSRYGDHVHDLELARLHLALILMIRGTPFLFNGEEIGMTDHLIGDPKLFMDWLGTRAYHLEKELMKSTEEEAIREGAREGRDKCRTPLQWRNVPNAGFCPPGVKPWLPINPNYEKGINVDDEERKPDSLLTFYRKMIHLRQSRQELILGEYQPIESSLPKVLAFERSIPGKKTAVILNFSDQPLKLAGKNSEYYLRVLFSNQFEENKKVLLKKTTLNPFEILIGEILNIK